MEHEDELLRQNTDEEQTHNNSSNGRESTQNGVNGRHLKKKKKEKEKPVKIQQRGLGVAELEKIRELEKLRELEEQRNKGVIISSSPVNGINAPLQANNLYSRSGSVPLRPPFATRTQSPNHLAYENYYSHVPGNPHLNVGHQSGAQLNSAGPGIGPGSNQMNSEYSREGEISTRSIHQANTSDQPNQPRNFPMQLGNQQSYFYNPSIVNHAAANSSSAVLTIQTEPPSNQSLSGTYRSVQPDEAEKILGTKRQHLCSPQDSPDPLAHCKNHSFPVHSLGRSNSIGTQGSFATNGNRSLRETLPCSVSMPNLLLRKDSRTDCRTTDGGFLKLGPPETTSLPPCSKFKHAVHYADTHQQAELPNPDSTTYQVRSQCSNLQGGSSISTNHHQQQGTYPNMVPASNNVQHGQSTVMSNHSNGTTEDKLDLSLKL